jgi:hypothetical protein
MWAITFEPVINLKSSESRGLTAAVADQHRQ